MSRQLRVRDLDKCPKRDEHTPAPEGYLAWHAWAEEMTATHRQRRHAPCGLFAIWVPKLAGVKP